MIKIAYVEKKDRDIFSSIINYKYSDITQQSQHRFLMAHMAEHIILENACRLIREEAGSISDLNKYISGLTDVEYSSFKVTADKSYQSHIKVFIDAISDREFHYITDKHFLEQKEAILKEYDYQKYSFKGCCNIFFNYMYELEEIDVKEVLHCITFEETLDFTRAFFSQKVSSMFWVGERSSGMQYSNMQISEIEREEEGLHPLDNKFLIKEMEGTGLSEIWFGKRFGKINSIYEYFELEILSKVVHFCIRYLLHREDMDIKVEFLGTQYTEKGSYFLCRSKSTLLLDSILDKIKNMNLKSIVREVSAEYRARLLIKLDSLVEYTRFANKMLLLTGTYFGKTEQYLEVLDLLPEERIINLILEIRNFECITFGE